jgi:hypothetical protein
MDEAFSALINPLWKAWVMLKFLQGGLDRFDWTEMVGPTIAKFYDCYHMPGDIGRRWRPGKQAQRSPAFEDSDKSWNRPSSNSFSAQVR